MQIYNRSLTEAIFVLQAMSTLGLIYYFMCLFCMHVCRGTTCMPGYHGGQEAQSYSLGLELQVTVSYHVGTGN